jgi:hypothetical protein
MENFDPNQPAEGLGDIIAKITHKLGIAKVAENIAHALGEEDCGCDKRREQLNELFPFNKDKKEEDATEGIKDEPPLQDQSS